MMNYLTPGIMVFTWFFILFLTFSNGSKVHFEFTEEESIIISRERNDFFQLLNAGNLSGSEAYLRLNKGLRYNSFNELEDNLNKCLLHKSYAAASFLIYQGVRITESIETVVVQVIEDNEAELLDLIIRQRFTNSTFFQDESKDLLNFEELILYAINSDRLEIFKVFFSSDFVKEQIKTKSFYTAMAKAAMDLNKNNLFDYIIDSRPTKHKKAILSSLLKHAVSSENFHVIQKCAENNLMFIILDPEQRINCLRLAAMNDCVITTQAVLRINSLVDILRLQSEDINSPPNIARRHGKRKVNEFYSTIF